MSARAYLARPAIGLLIVATLGCQSTGGGDSALDKKSTQGAILGALAGAAAGRAIGGHENAAEGIAIGAVTGAVAGGLVGHYLDTQSRELDAIPDANVERSPKAVVVGFSGSVLFESGSAELSPGGAERLRSLAETLRRYPKSDVVVKGYTDSTGSEAYNLRLSEERADRVKRLLVGEGIAASRVTAVGFGERFALASNDTPEGRQQNRRVEIEIKPWDEVFE